MGKNLELANLLWEVEVCKMQIEEVKGLLTTVLKNSILEPDKKNELKLEQNQAISVAFNLLDRVNDDFRKSLDNIYLELDKSNGGESNEAK